MAIEQEVAMNLLFITKLTDMPDYIESEEKIKDLFPVGETFTFEGKEYRVTVSGKPRPSKGECKTDVYVEARSDDGETKEFKISVKKTNANFLENKIKKERARELFGDEMDEILKKSIAEIEKEFENDPLVCFEAYGKTYAHTIKLGWRFELLNVKSGNKAGEIYLSDDQKIDVYAGTNLPTEKKDCSVNGTIIKNSGVANFIMVYDGGKISRKECLKMLVPIEDYAKNQKIYFACKAVNYRHDVKKWERNRALAVYVEWKAVDGKLCGRIVCDDPLEYDSNRVCNELMNALNSLKVKKFDDLKGKLSDRVAKR